MLSEVIELQDKAVTELVDKIGYISTTTFKAPTGSGKTYMMADLMNRVLSEEENVIFLVSSLSKGELAKQNYEKFVEYSDNHSFDKLKPYLITSETSGENRLHIPTDYNVYVLPRDLYKEKSKLKQGALPDFLRAVTIMKPLGLGKKIYVIRDECHQATNNLDSLADDYFEKVINFSATPRRDHKVTVELREVDAINSHLIKVVEYQNEDDTLDMALDKFEEIKERYVKNLGINPCMIIQISNKNKADEELKEIYDILGKRAHLKWMLIVDGDKGNDTNDIIKTKKMAVNKWRDYAKTNTATIDIIIFKQVITEGWDIPRACMLYQIRDAKSSILNEQVIGRVRRNPCLLNYETLNEETKELVSTAYVWGLREREEKAIQQVKLVGSIENNEVEKELKVKTTKIKDITDVNTFDITEFIDRQRSKVNVDSIFTMHKKYVKSTNEVKNLASSYVDSVSKWFKFVENIDAINTEVKNIVCDYSSNMELLTDDNGNPVEVSLPLLTYYTDNGNYRNISNWLWQRTDNNNEFSFDSDAEKEWCGILVDLINEDAPTGNGRIIKAITVQEENEDVKKYLIGKNYLANSMVKYEYYLNGIHSSYPDFIMKDFRDRIHLFETKCMNIAANSNIDDEEYEDKIKALQDAYKFASKLTGYYFYIPIKKGSDWVIYQYANGTEEILSKQSFIKFMKS